MSPLTSIWPKRRMYSGRPSAVGCYQFRHVHFKWWKKNKIGTYCHKDDAQNVDTTIIVVPASRVKLLYCWRRFVRSCQSVNAMPLSPGQRVAQHLSCFLNMEVTSFQEAQNMSVFGYLLKRWKRDQGNYLRNNEVWLETRIADKMICSTCIRLIYKYRVSCNMYLSLVRFLKPLSELDEFTLLIHRQFT